MKKNGFTLIELLVVIAIIAILAAILFPIFIRVQATARMTKCLDNVKQINGACMLYEGDYDGGMVQGFNSGTWGDWYANTNIYLKQMYKKDSATYDLRGVWLCPAIPYSRHNGTGQPIDSNLKRCYGYNYAYLGGDSVNGVYTWHRNTEVTKASKTVRILEIWGWHHKGSASGQATMGWGTAYCYPPVAKANLCKPDQCWPPGWHSAGRSVVAWCDGHVSTAVFVQPQPGNTSYPAGTYTGRTNVNEKYYMDDGNANHGDPYYRLKAPKP